MFFPLENIPCKYLRNNNNLRVGRFLCNIIIIIILIGNRTVSIDPRLATLPDFLRPKQRDTHTSKDTSMCACIQYATNPQSLNTWRSQTRGM